MVYTAENGICSSKDSSLITVFDSSSANCVLSVNRDFQTNGLEIWPNPARRKVNIRSNWTGQSEIKLFNGFGQLVFNQQLLLGKSPSEVVLPEWLSNGIYFLKIRHNGEESSNSLILE